MRDVIFTTVIGEKYRAMAHLLVDTLRRQGQWEGRLIVFADEPLKTGWSVDEPIEKIYKDYGHEQEVTNIQACRIGGARRLIEHGYDRIFYLDADCLAIRPVQPLFERVQNRNLVTLGKGPTESGYLMPEELGKSFPLINSGSWLGTARTLELMLDGWEQVLMEGEFAADADQRLREQAALNAWCHRNPLEWESLPPYWITVGPVSNPLPEAKIIHFLATQAGLMGTFYEQLNAHKVQKEKED